MKRGVASRGLLILTVMWFATAFIGRTWGSSSEAAFLVQIGLGGQALIASYICEAIERNGQGL